MAGIAEFPRHSTEMDQIVNQADAALDGARLTAATLACRRGRGEPGTGEDPRAGDGVRRRNMLSTLQQLAKAVDAKNRSRSTTPTGSSAYAVELAEPRLTRRASSGSDRRPLHDVGKIGVPTPILLKEGPLNLEDLDQLRATPSSATR